jgi:hypothetical protein
MVVAPFADFVADQALLVQSRASLRNFFIARRECKELARQPVRCVVLFSVVTKSEKVMATERGVLFWSGNYFVRMESVGAVGCCFCTTIALMPSAAITANRWARPTLLRKGPALS